MGSDDGGDGIPGAKAELLNQGYSENIAHLDMVSGPRPRSDRDDGADEPIHRTMVETVRKTPSEGNEPLDYLPESLADLFVKKEISDPRVRALLQGLESIDCRELEVELRDFAGSMGASHDRN